MLCLDVLKVCNSKGIDNPKRFLLQHGFPHSAVFCIVNNSQDRISYPLLQKLCNILYYKLNDLMTWQATEANVFLPEHPLTTYTKASIHF